MITSPQNQRVKLIRRLRRSKGDRLLLEGPHLVEEALAAGLVLEEILVTPPFLDSVEGRRLFPRFPFPPLEVSSDVLEGLTDADSPRGLLAVATLPRSGAESLPLRPGRPYLYLDGLQDPGNLGALARVAEAAGAAGLALSPGCSHPNHPRALRASAGSLLRLPVAVNASPDDLEARFAPLQPRWAALVPREGEDLYHANLEGTVLLAVGAEGPGLSPALQARAGLRLTIPMEPQVESLNATVAAALVLFEIRRRTVSL